MNRLYNLSLNRCLFLKVVNESKDKRMRQ